MRLKFSRGITSESRKLVTFFKMVEKNMLHQCDLSFQEGKGLQNVDLSEASFI